MKKAKYLLTIIFLLFLTVIACITANSAQASLSPSLSEKISSQDRNLKNNSAYLPVATAELVHNNKLIQSLSPRGDSTEKDDLPVHITWNSESAPDLFASVGSAAPVYKTDENGKKVFQYFKMTDDQPGQVGGLVLRSSYTSKYAGVSSKLPFDMDITFEIKSDKNSNGPGNGFAVFTCPEIKFGENYKDGAFKDPTPLPQMPKNQDIYSLGLPGANLGASDLIGTSGIYVATKGADKTNSQVGDYNLYGAPSHSWIGDGKHELFANNVGEKKDNYLSLLPTNTATYQMYTQPDPKVYNRIIPNISKIPIPGSMNFRGYLSNQKIFTPNISNGQWYRVQYILNTKFDTLDIKIWNADEYKSNPKTASTVVDTATSLNGDYSYMFLGFYNRMYLKITATTGTSFSKQYVRNLHGKIDVSQAGNTIAQKVDANGKPIDDNTKEFSDTQSHKITEPIRFHRSSDDSDWILSRINVQNIMTDGTIEKKRRVSVNDITREDKDNWSYQIPDLFKGDSKSVLVRDVNFVYRRAKKKPQLKIDLIQDDNSPTNQVTLNPGDSVKVNLTLTNPLDGPDPWNKVSAWIVKPKNLDFIKDSNDNKVSLNKNGYLVADFGDFSSNENKTVSYTLKNNSNSKVDLNNDTENLLEQTIYLYDQSPENFDDDGQLLQSSYYYDENTCDGPLGSSTSLPNFNTYTDLDYGNYIPRWGSEVKRMGKVVFHYWDIDDPDSKVSMDPSSDKVPLKEINDLKPKTVTGDLGTPVVGSLPNGTDAVQQAAGISNPQAPAPNFPGYKYLGYYEYDGTQSTFHSYYPSSAPDVGSEDSPDLSNGNVDTTFKTGEMHDPPQSIAFIYRKRSLDGALSLQVPSELQFGSHLTTKRKFSANDAYQVTINDFRNNRGLPLNQKNGNYQLSVQTTNELSGKKDNKINNAWLTFGDPTITSNKSNDYSPNINKVSKIFSSNDKLNIGKSDKHSPLAIMNSNQFGSFKLVWTKEDINLNIGTNQKIKSDSYDAQITWQLTDSISN